MSPKAEEERVIASSFDTSKCRCTKTKRSNPPVASRDRNSSVSCGAKNAEASDEEKVLVLESKEKNKNRTPSSTWSPDHRNQAESWLTKEPSLVTWEELHRERKKSPNQTRNAFSFGQPLSVPETAGVSVRVANRVNGRAKRME